MIEASPATDVEHPDDCTCCYGEDPGHADADYCPDCGDEFETQPCSCGCEAEEMFCPACWGDTL